MSLDIEILKVRNDAEFGLFDTVFNLDKIKEY